MKKKQTRKRLHPLVKAMGLLDTATKLIARELAKKDKQPKKGSKK